MNHLLSSLRSFVRRDSGQDLFEYVFLVAFLALFVVFALTTTGGSVDDIFSDVASAIGGDGGDGDGGGDGDDGDDGDDGSGGDDDS